MGACTVTVPTYGGTGNFKARAYSVHFNRKVVRAVVNPSSSYATGGDSISLANLGLKTIAFVTQIKSIGGAGSMMVPAATAAYRNVITPEVDVTDPAAPKLKLYSASNTEETATTDRSTLAYLFEFYGN